MTVFWNGHEWENGDQTCAGLSCWVAILWTFPLDQVTVGTQRPKSVIFFGLEEVS